MLFFSLALLLTAATAMPASDAVRTGRSLLRPNDHDHCYDHEVIPIDEYDDCVDKLLDSPRHKDCGAVQDKPNTICSKGAMKLTMWNVGLKHAKISCNFVGKRLSSFDRGQVMHCASQKGCLGKEVFEDMRNGFSSFPVAYGRC
jgi:hypothetical protein